MKALQFIRTHLVALLCGVVAIAAVAFGVLGMMRDTVVKELEKEKRQTGASSIRSLVNDPENEETIAAVKKRGEEFEREYQKTRQVAQNINARPVLMDGVFPQPGKTAAPFEFAEAYKRAMKLLPTKVDADTLPTEADIREEELNIEDQLALEAEQKAEEEGEEGGRAPPVISRGPTPPSIYGPGRLAPGAVGRVAPGAVGRLAPGAVGRMAPGPVGPASPSTRLPTEKRDEPKYNPIYRARVAKAKSMLCYYDEGSSFHHSPLEYQVEPPTPEQMWYAQVVEWVQEDVVKAIGDLNREAADQVSGADACVEHVPVKRIVFVRVLGYQGPQGFLPFPDASGTPAASVPPAGPSFTGRKSNEQYDVVRFVVSVVVDQRDILRLIDRISRANFYQCLGARYEAVNQGQARADGYFYGTDPVVQVTLEFEGYMARDLYANLMPPSVRQALGIDAAEGEGD